jgi:hypothetical protein
VYRHSATHQKAYVSGGAAGCRAMHHLGGFADGLNSALPSSRICFAGIDHSQLSASRCTILTLSSFRRACFSSVQGACSCAIVLRGRVYVGICRQNPTCYTYDEVKSSSQQNRELRLAAAK